MSEGISVEHVLEMVAVADVESQTGDMIGVLVEGVCDSISVLRISVNAGFDGSAFIPSDSGIRLSVVSIRMAASSSSVSVATNHEWVPSPYSEVVEGLSFRSCLLDAKRMNRDEYSLIAEKVSALASVRIASHKVRSWDGATIIKIEQSVSGSPPRKTILVNVGEAAIVPDDSIVDQVRLVAESVLAISNRSREIGG